MPSIAKNYQFYQILLGNSTMYVIFYSANQKVWYGLPVCTPCALIGIQSQLHQVKHSKFGMTGIQVQFY